MFVATMVLSVLLAFVFGAGAVGKLTRMKSQVGNAAKLKITWPRYRLIAAPEGAGAVGLLTGLAVWPLGVAAGIGLVALMGARWPSGSASATPFRSSSATPPSWCSPVSQPSFAR
jgi:hypothetical protein